MLNQRTEWFRGGLPGGVVLAAGVGLLTGQAVADPSFDDVVFWVGSGSNQAGLVIDWKDGPEPRSLLWGYRWDGEATVDGMLEAVAGADPNLYLHMGEFDWGRVVLGLGYELSGGGDFAVEPGLTFVDGIAVSSDPDDGRASVNPGDHWAEGWLDGFWSYWLGGSGDSPEWESAQFGLVGRPLVDGSWDGLSWLADWTQSA
ncbi:MAG: hypothetical protein JJU36_08215, partial [Phycisphaeraceae bacterium]|nr:hypothetical protein [Phycisphaeraceae bacterium]